MTRLIEALPTSRTSTNRLRTAVGLLLVAGFALGPVGCDRKDASAKAITGAGRKLEAVATSAGAGAAPSYVEASLGAVRKDAKDVGSDAAAADSASASLISARAASGLAGVKAAEAARLEGVARGGEQTESGRRHGILEVYAALDAYLDQSAFATSMEHFDPTSESKRLADEIAAKEQEISKAAATKRQLQDEAAKLDSDAQAALSSAQAERTAEAQIRAQAPTAGTQAKTDLVTQASQRRRAADGFDKKAADLRAQGAVLAPRIEQADVQLNHLTSQRKLLQDATAEVQAMSQSSKQRATQARAAATTGAADIAKIVEDVEKTRGEIDAPTKAAIDGYKSAAAEARKASQGASREGGAAAKLAAGSYLANAGAVAGIRTEGYRAYASMLEGLAQAQPALPNASKYATTAAEARKAEADARKEAQELYGQAKDAVSGAGGGEELKAAAEKISASLEALSQSAVQPAKSLALGGEPAKASGAAPAPTPAGDAPASGAEDEIRAMLSSLGEVIDSGDEARFEKTILLPDGPFKDLFRAIADVDKAFREKFNVSAAEATQQAGLPSTAENFAKMGVPSSLSDITVATTGPEAGTIGFTMMGMPMNVPVKKVDGAWALDIAGSAELKQVLGMASAMVAPQIATLKQFAADIRAGKFADATAAIKAMEAAMSAGPGGG